MSITSKQSTLLPYITFHFVCQIASLLSDTSSVLNECMNSFTQSEDFKSLLGTQKDLGQLEDIGELLLLILHLQTVHILSC